MARKRMIDPGIWTSTTFEGLSCNEARLLVVWLISNADDEGRLRGNLAIIRGSLFTFSPEFTERDVDKWLDELVKLSFLTRYTQNDFAYIQLNKWDDYQSIHNPTPSKLPSLHDEGCIVAASMPHKCRKRAARPLSNGMEWNRMEENIEGDAPPPASPSGEGSLALPPEPEYPAELVEAVRIATRNPDKTPGPKDVDTWRFLQKASNLARGKGFTPIEILETVRAMRADDEPELSGFCWSQQLQSFSNLSKRSRKGELTKFENAYGKLFVKIQRGIEQRRLDAQYDKREWVRQDIPPPKQPPPATGPQPDLPAITSEKREANLAEVLGLANKLARKAVSA